MELRELKNKILNNTISNSFIILVCDNDYFLAEQYVNKLCEQNNSKIHVVDSLAELLTATSLLFTDENSDLNIYKTDLFDEFYEDYSIFNNCFVFCHKVDKKIADKVMDYVVNIPALVDWQVKAYITTKCPGLDQGSANWLFDTSGQDLYKLTTELDKIALFNSKDQLSVLSALRFEPGSDLYNKTLFQLSNDIINGNKVAILDYSYHQDACDFEPLALVSLLLKSFKKAYLIKYHSGLTLEELGVSSNQYKYLGTHTPYTETFLLKVIQFLSAIDYRLKSGQLELSKQQLLIYIINNILSFEAMV